MDSLNELRTAVGQKQQPVLLDEAGQATESINVAKQLKFNDLAIFDLSEKTRFTKGETQTALDLKTVYYAYLLRESSSTEYIQACSERNILNLSFLEKTDLLAWLEGAPTSEHITPTPEESKRAAQAQIDEPAAKRQAGKVERPETLLRIYRQEHTIHQFSWCLHGRKPTDFSSVQREAKEFFMMSKGKGSDGRPIPAGPQSSSSGINGATTGKGTKGKMRDPIILLSPSASSLITMHNVKKFLEEGTFIAPDQAAREANGPPPELLSLSRKSSAMPGYTLRIMVVESPDKFKPDYWDRVICVFTTGQQWQFKTYQHSEPRVLFHHVKGFLVQYADEPEHAALRDWNVQGIKIERNRRHQDRVIVASLWDSLERWIAEKNKKDFYRREKRE